MRKFFASAKVKHLLKAVCFCLFLLLGYVSVTRIFMLKNEEELTTAYYDCEPGENQIIFLGPSTIMNSVYPMELWKEFGWQSYNLGTGAQTVAMSYYLAREAIERDHPSLIVLDCGRIKFDEKVSVSGWVHYITDGMPFWSKNRQAMIEDLVEEEEADDYLFPLNSYHTRWKEEITKNDFEADGKALTRGAKAEVHFKETQSYELQEVNTENALGATSMEYMDRIVEMCKAEDVDLLLLTVPFAGMRPDIKQVDFNTRRNAAYALEEYAKEKGVQYLNLLDKWDEIGISEENDTVDGMHYCISGALKFTNFLGEYIRGHYEIKEAAATKDLTDDYERYSLYVENKALQMASSTEEYLTYLADMMRDGKRDLNVFISVKDVIGPSFDEKFIELFEALGLKEQLQGLWQYGYIASVGPEGVLYEKRSADINVAESYHGETENLQIDIFSGPLEDGNRATIGINGYDYAVDSRGINIVVWDNARNKVLDSCAMDTFREDCPITHRTFDE